METGQPLTATDFEILPLTRQRWPDLETLFGERGAVGGCWCMYWRLQHAEYEQLKGAGNRALLHELAQADPAPGLLAYRQGNAVGWCSLGPRQDFSRLSRSRILAPVDEQPVWSVVCFYIHRQHRRQGLSLRLLDAAVNFARAHGAAILEGYPVEPESGQTPAVFAYTGLARTFRQLGFQEVARRSATRPVMRLQLLESEPDEHKPPGN
jgi:GNAT superfamily N-acetyltransferase